MNWYAPCFRSIGVNTTDINDIQLNDGTSAGEMPTVGWGDSMQIVGPLGSASGMYFYYDASMNPAGVEGGNFWGDENMSPVDISFDEGDGLAIDNANALTFNIVGSGDVSTNDVVFAARSNLNWSGNPFPMAIDINSIQLDDGTPTGEMPTVGWGDSMQIVGPLGSASEMYFYYDASMNPAGAEGGNFWGDENMSPISLKLSPGAGFAIDNANGLTFNIVIKCK